VKPTVAQPAQTPPAETKTVETKPAETVAATDTRPVKQVQRKSRQRQVSVEQRMHREFRNIERIVIPAIGFAIAGSSFYW
jgi:hypothetical protein